MPFCARQAEIDLRQSESRFRAIFEKAPDGVALLDGDLTFVVVNPAMCQSLEREDGTICRRSLREFVPTKNQSVIDEIRKEINESGTWRGILPLQGANGLLVKSDWNLSTHAAPGLWLAIVDDITECIKYEAEREQLLLNEQNVGRSGACYSL